MKDQIENLINIYQIKAEKCRDKGQQYRNRDDIYASFIASSETYELVIIDLKNLIKTL